MLAIITKKSPSKCLPHVSLIANILSRVMTMTYIVTILTIIDGQDDDFDFMTINLNHGHGNDFELDHL